MTNPMPAVIVLYVIVASTLATSQPQIQNNCPYGPPHERDLACLIPDITKTGGSSLSTFNTTLAQVVAQLPVAVPISGFALTLDRTLGIYVVPNDSLGSVLTERGDTLGKYKLFLGVTYQHFKFDSIDGTDLKNLPTVYVYPNSQAPQGFGTQLNSLGAHVDQYTAFAAFGLSDRMDVSLTLPIERIALSATATNIFQVPVSGGNPFCPSGGSPPCANLGPVSGTASGPGDLLLNGKYAFWKGEKSRIAGGLEVRFQTGDEYNLLGSGAVGFKPYVVFSRRGRYTPHANFAYQWNGRSVLFPNSNAGGYLRLPDSLEYSAGVDIGITKRFTVIGDLLGRHFFDAPRVTRAVPASQSIKGLPPELSNLPTVGIGRNSFDEDNFAVGIKVNPVGKLLVSANVLIKLNDGGLRADYVPLVGISYKF